MAITLEQAKLNTQDDYDATVIDEFRKNSVVLDNLTFDATPSGNQCDAQTSPGWYRAG